MGSRRPSDDSPSDSDRPQAERTTAEDAGQGGAALPGPPLTYERGARIDRYFILEKIGAGGMAVVYKAYDRELGRTVALKLLDVRRRAKRILSHRLLREAQALARLSHPNVIAVHDVGTLDDNVFVAMEFVDGTTLLTWLSQARRTQRQILDVFLAAGEGLAAAHRAGIVHRDFKPDNVMIGVDGRVRVLDFGLARAAASEDAIAPESGPRADAPHSPAPPSSQVLASPSPIGPFESQTTAYADLEHDSDASIETGDGSASSEPSVDHLAQRLTVAGAVMGTPPYMAPEQHLGTGADERADQFSFCVSLYHALYGALPFAGETAADLRLNVLAGRIAAPPSTARVSRWTRQVLLRGLAVDPPHRYASMSELLAALRSNPREKLWRWVLAGLLLAAVVVAALGWRTQQRSQARACRLAAEELGSAWNDTVKNQVRSAFAAGSASYAADTYERLAGLLDRYTSTWVAMRIDACEATQIRGEQSAHLMDLRMHCLDRRANELSALLTVFTHAPDRSVVEHAVDAVGGLGDVSACADRSALLAAISPPSDPKTRERVASSRARLDEAQALERAGQSRAALERAVAAREESRAIGYAPLESEAALLVGLLQKQVSDAVSAEASLRDAVQVAAKAHDDIRAAAAWTELLHLVGHWMARPDDGLALRPWAEAAVVRAGDTPALRAKLLMSTSEVLQQAGRSAEALADAERAVALWEQASSPDSLETARALAAMARVLGAFERWGDAQTAAERALANTERHLGPRHPEVGRTLMLIGNFLVQRGRELEAQPYLERALSIAERSSGSMSSETRGIYMGLGIISEHQGDWAQAVLHYQRALAVGDEFLGPTSSFSGVALFNLHGALRHLGRYGDARQACERAVDILVHKHAVGPDHPIVASTWECLGFVSFDERRYDEAFVRFRRAVAVAEQASPNMPDHALELVYLGEAYLAKGSYRDALPLLSRAVTVLEAHEVPARDRGAARFALARALWQTGTDRKRALALAAQAREDYASAGAGLKADADRVATWLTGRNP